MNDELRGKARSHVKLGDLERPRLDHTLYLEPDRPPDTIGMDPEDGLPRPVPSVSVEQARAPTLSVENFVCMADTSLFVIRDLWGEPVATFSPDVVARTADGRYRVPITTALSAGTPFVALLSRLRGRWCLVEPVRPQCNHYRRQFKPWPDDPDVHQCIRYCMALQDENGEMISLNDEVLLACEIRHPAVPGGSEQIDAYDQTIIAGGKQSESAEFDVDAALSQGIFEKKDSQ